MYYLYIRFHSYRFCPASVNQGNFVKGSLVGISFNSHLAGF
jgi:hypothetical protein